MTKRSPWQLLVQDDDRKLFAFTGHITDDRPWNIQVVQAQESGRNVRCQSTELEREAESRNWVEGLGYTRVDILDILDLPEDTSMLYSGKLPKFASHADRRRVIRILCKGRCGKPSWAELNADYPGKLELRTAEDGVYIASCLKCGHPAPDNYNWHR